MSPFTVVLEHEIEYDCSFFVDKMSHFNFNLNYTRFRRLFVETGIHNILLTYYPSFSYSVLGIWVCEREPIHPASTTLTSLTSDWSLKSYVMVVMEKHFSCALHRKF